MEKKGPNLNVKYATVFCGEVHRIAIYYQHWLHHQGETRIRLLKYFKNKPGIARSVPITCGTEWIQLHAQLSLKCTRSCWYWISVLIPVRVRYIAPNYNYFYNILLCKVHKTILELLLEGKPSGAVSKCFLEKNFCCRK